MINFLSDEEVTLAAGGKKEVVWESARRAKLYLLQDPRCSILLIKRIRAGEVITHFVLNWDVDIL